MTSDMEKVVPRDEEKARGGSELSFGKVERGTIVDERDEYTERAYGVFNQVQFQIWGRVICSSAVWFKIKQDSGGIYAETNPFPNHDSAKTRFIFTPILVAYVFF